MRPDFVADVDVSCNSVWVMRLLAIRACSMWNRRCATGDSSTVSVCENDISVFGYNLFNIGRSTQNYIQQKI